MKIVVTGASGFVGSMLIAQIGAVERGIAVSRAKQSRILPHGWEWVTRDSLLTSERTDIEVVVHLEVKQHVFLPTAATDAMCHLVNVKGTADWLSWCSRNGVNRFVYFSSTKAVTPNRDGPTDENAPPCRGNAYGESKWAAEELVREWVRNSATRSALILRPAVIYGPGNKGNISAMVQGIYRRRFFLVGSGANVKSLVSLRNAVAAVGFLLAEGGSGCEVFNLVDRQSYSVREIAAMVYRALGRKGLPLSVPVSLMRICAAVGDLIGHMVRREPPFTRVRLRALIESTYFTADKIIDAGFVHPQTTEEGIREMVRLDRIGW